MVRKGACWSRRGGRSLPALVEKTSVFGGYVLATTLLPHHAAPGHTGTTSVYSDSSDFCGVRSSWICSGGALSQGVLTS